MHPEGDLKQRSESQQVMIYNNMAGNGCKTRSGFKADCMFLKAALAKQEKWDRALDSAKKVKEGD